MEKNSRRTIKLLSSDSSRLQPWIKLLVNNGDIDLRSVIKVLDFCLKVDADGKKYDKVSRIEAESSDGETTIVLDINSELYPMKRKELYRMVISTTLMEGTAVTSYPPEGKSLLDKFEYIVHGLVYKVSMEGSGADKKVVVYVSFGGLQLMLKSDAQKTQKFKLDQKLFLLLRKMVK